MESSAEVCDENEKRTAVHTNLVVGSLDENDATSRTEVYQIMINVLVTSQCRGFHMSPLIYNSGFAANKTIRESFHFTRT